MEYDVTEDRSKYIGGSDIPIIMNLSSFKTRWQLLQEKAELIEPIEDNFGEKYKQYGNDMEGYIRDYVNESRGINCQPNRAIEGFYRYHSDGCDNINGYTLEVKTTSRTHEKLEGYKLYLVQLLTGMRINKTNYGVLAVYNRPENLSIFFDKSRLQEFFINIDDYQELLNEIDNAVNKFVEDLQKLKDNPSLTESDLQPNELITLSNQVEVFERQLEQYKSIEEQYKNVKAKLKEAMKENNVKKWTTNNGTQITLVADGKSTTTNKLDEKTLKEENEEVYNQYLKEIVTTKFDEESFKENNKEIYDKYLKKSVKKGRTGYVKITLAKG